MVGTPKKENLDRYCDYHREKEHYTNDCYQLKRQLEAALESGKLSYLVKDVRQRGNNRGIQQGNSNTNGKIINMIRVRGENRKRKYQMGQEEDWINTPITFPPILADDVSDEPLIIEAKASSPYNIILGRTGIKELRAISSITHAMMKFPTPWGVQRIENEAKM
ncbi:hypothetical protein Tco_1530210, partial [Tanacetum coccineum]